MNYYMIGGLTIFSGYLKLFILSCWSMEYGYVQIEYDKDLRVVSLLSNK